MSWSFSKKGKAKEVEASLEREGQVAKVGRNGFEEKAIDLCVELGVQAVKHASIDEGKQVEVQAYGHHNDDGTGSVYVKVEIGEAV